MSNDKMAKTFILIAALLSNLFQSATATTSDQKVTHSGPFLQAQVSMHAISQGLSRTELDPNQPSMAAINPTEAQFASASMQARTAILSGNAQNQFQNQQTNLSGNTKNQMIESDMSTDVRAREYNVDWASWISHFADRWYFVLKQYEMSQNAHYVTERPALFQFTCYTNGTVANVVLKQSSGNIAYDRLQVIALMQAMPAPPFPVGTHRQSITLVQGWESHVRKPGENDFIPGSFGRGFPMEKVKEWVQTN
ncbi:MAG: TonB C-terminal domain-containing protein [Candidatus Obscuribacterales bacterium]|nr:TonB C-terminal domain-containing protein [Candidatus Obscuribacterales bacterium]